MIKIGDFSITVFLISLLHEILSKTLKGDNIRLIAAEYRILGIPTIPILNLFSASNRKKFVKVEPAKGSKDTSIGSTLKSVIDLHCNQERLYLSSVILNKMMTSFINILLYICAIVDRIAKIKNLFIFSSSFEF